MLIVILIVLALVLAGTVRYFTDPIVAKQLSDREAYRQNLIDNRANPTT
jgi:hypothetical protein